jgi:hypothetical protein
MASPSHVSLRRAFYPCCADDIEEPRRLLAGAVEGLSRILCKRFSAAILLSPCPRR